MGASPPLNIIVLPILFEGSVLAVIELASFAAFSPTHQSLLDQLTESIGLVLNTVDANAVTDRLLEQSQSQAQELQSRQEQLHQSNEDLAKQAALLADKNSEVESKYQEVEEAKRLVEEKATELSVSSKYKSEFIANMSHELRTPLNSLLVLAEQLEDNPDGNLTEQQIRCQRDPLVGRRPARAAERHPRSRQGRVQHGAPRVRRALPRRVSREHRASLRARRLGAGPRVLGRADPGLPRTIRTDAQRLGQVLKNLLSNAFKFTETGKVTVRLEGDAAGWDPDHERLARADSVIAISVTDTGIGIKQELQTAMFEAFAQADGTAARQYGGTGLGLSISRNLVDLLGGQITLKSAPGAGSTLTVYLPVEQLTAEAEASTPDRNGLGCPRRGAGRCGHSGRCGSDRRRDLPGGRINGTANAVMLDGDHERRPKHPPVRAFYDGVDEGATVLVVDDDFRNIFSMTALLERGKLNVIAAESGAEALTILDERTDVDIVLMDIMMPVMDGYETMTEIRKRPRLQGTADRRGHRQGRPRRTRALPRRRRHRLHSEAGRYRGTARGVGRVVPARARQRLPET